MSMVTPHELAHQLAQVDMKAANELTGDVAHIAALAQSLAELIRGAGSAWKGDDADRFLAEWRGRLETLVDIQNRILANATELRYVAANRYQSMAGA